MGRKARQKISKYLQICLYNTTVLKQTPKKIVDTVGTTKCDTFCLYTMNR